MYYHSIGSTSMRSDLQKPAEFFSESALTSSRAKSNTCAMPQSDGGTDLSTDQSDDTALAQYAAKLREEIRHNMNTLSKEARNLDPTTVTPGRLIQIAIRHCVQEKMFAGGPAMVVQLWKTFEWGLNKTGHYYCFTRKHRFSPEEIRKQPKAEPSSARDSVAHNYQGNASSLIYDEIDDIEAANGHFNGRLSDAKVRYELETMSAPEAAGALVKATGEVGHILLSELLRCRPDRMDLAYRYQLTKGIEHRLESALEAGKKLETRQDAQGPTNAVALELTKLHYLIQELTHTLCIHHQLPQYQRTLWFKMLVEHPTKNAEYIDMYDDGREPWSKVIRGMNQRLFTDDKDKKLSGQGPYFIMAAEHGKGTWAEGMKTAREIVSDKAYAEMWRLHAESDRITHNWGTRPVAYVWRQSVIKKLKKDKKRKAQTAKHNEEGDGSKRSRGENTGKET